MLLTAYGLPKLTYLMAHVDNLDGAKPRGALGRPPCTKMNTHEDALFHGDAG